MRTAQQMQALEALADGDIIDVGPPRAITLGAIRRIQEDHAVNLKGSAIQDLPSPRQEPIRLDSVKGRRSHEGLQVER